MTAHVCAKCGEYLTNIVPPMKERVCDRCREKPKDVDRRLKFLENERVGELETDYKALEKRLEESVQNFDERFMKFMGEDYRSYKRLKEVEDRLNVLEKEWCNYDVRPQLAELEERINNLVTGDAGLLELISRVHALEVRVIYVDAEDRPEEFTEQEKAHEEAIADLKMVSDDEKLETCFKEALHRLGLGWENSELYETELREGIRAWREHGKIVHDGMGEAENMVSFFYRRLFDVGKKIAKQYVDSTAIGGYREKEIERLRENFSASRDQVEKLLRKKEHYECHPNPDPSWEESLDHALAENERLRAIAEEQRAQLCDIKEALGLAAGGTGLSLAEEIERLRGALGELVTIVEGHLTDGDILDSFTTQPARRVLAMVRSAKEMLRVDPSDTWCPLRDEQCDPKCAEWAHGERRCSEGDDD